jgi:probable rRNA maturation factor
MTALPELDLQIDLEAGNWPEEQELRGLVERVLNGTARHLATQAGQPFPIGPVEVSLVFTGDAEMRAINRQWREQDKPTNVLSFPAYPVQPGKMPGPMLGDIILAQETLAREAAEMGVSFEHHLAHLLVHGFLHLLGYDHIEETDAKTMEALETGILAELGVSDPYGHDD